VTDTSERASGRVVPFPNSRVRPVLSLPLAQSHEPACSQCGGPWRDLGHCKGVCLRCGYMQSCVDTR